MKVYIDTFDSDEEAQEVARELSRIGIRTEIKTFLDVIIEGVFYIEGKLSELKKKCIGTPLESNVKKWERFFSIIRSNMKDGIDIEEFNKRVLDEIMPERKSIPSLEELVGKEKLEEIKDVSEEEKIKFAEETFAKTDRSIIERFAKQAEMDMYVIDSIHEMLEMNGISYKDGKIYGDIPSDPMLRIYISPEEIVEKLEPKEEYEIYVDRRIDVYANLTDIYFEVEKLEELCSERPYLAKLLAMVNITIEILDRIKGKTDLEELIKSVEVIEKEGDTFFLTREAINDILKTFEKENIIKIKKGTVKINA